MKKSKLFRLDFEDLKRGFIVSVLTASLSALYNTIIQRATINIQEIVLIGLAAGISYVIKNLATNSQDQLFTKEPNN